jgi:flagellar biosynthetic protein FlhB
MAEQTSLGERTEKPSPKRLRDARARGDVPRSQDLVTALSLLAVTLVLIRSGETAFVRIAQRLVDGLHRMGQAARTPIGAGDLGRLAIDDLWMVMMVTGPALAAAATVAVAGNVVQSGWVFAPERLTPDWNRLSPAAGWSRLKPSTSGVTMLKASVAVTALGVVAWRVGLEMLTESPRFVGMSAPAVAMGAWLGIRALLIQAGVTLFAIAAFDLGWQWWRHYQSLKMTRQELVDEAKSTEGRPEIKARVRRIQREMNRRRMLTAVKTATVVVTNPTHYAVALEYHRATMSAPTVVAKGKDLLAERIKQIARDHGVPTVENVPLAQALYKGADVGESIPAGLFGAVAEVLAYLIRIKQLVL